MSTFSFISLELGKKEKERKKKKNKCSYVSKVQRPETEEIPVFVFTSIDSVAFLPPVLNDMPSF